MPAEPGCLHVRIPDGADPEVVADGCWALGATAIGELDGALEVGFPTIAHAHDALAALAGRFPGLDGEVVDAGPALAAAMAAWKPYARPVRVGRLHVRPSWLDDADDPPGPGEVLVVVDPERAFGYDHPSTQACLAVVERVVGEGTSVLDVGCGSGVLAVAAALLGAAPVVAIDVDPVAVAATEAAAGRAGVVVAASTAGVDEVAGGAGERFDLVLANIGAATLTALADPIVAAVAPGGSLVLAGLLAGQVPAVAAAYRSGGLVLLSVEEDAGWATPVFLRKSTTSGD